MSALPPIADMVRLFDHLVRRDKKALRYRESKRLGGLEIDRHFEFGRLLHGQVAGLFTLENSIDVTRHATVKVLIVDAVEEKTTRASLNTRGINSRHLVMHRKGDDEIVIGRGAR